MTALRRLAAALVAIVLAVAGGPRWPAAEVLADDERSTLSVGWFGRWLDLDLHLDAPVPFRVFTLDAPRRLVADFAGLDWRGFDPDALSEGLRTGQVTPGWSRLVLDLEAPLALASAEMVPDGTGTRLEVRLERVSPEDFSEAAGAPPGVWPAGRAAPDPGAVTVAIDPGHGGPDPGAVRAGVREKDVTLAFAATLARELASAGFRVVSTRDGDEFVPLDARVAAARAAGADVLLSIHANAIGDTSLRGAIVFTRSDRGSSRAAAERARTENRADRLAGLAAFAPSDPVGAALFDMARIESEARSDLLARRLVARLGAAVQLSPAARQSADFRVLAAPEMPAVLVELGFLSNPEDRAAMSSEAWRRDAARAIRTGLEDWLSRDGGPALK